MDGDFEEGFDPSIQQYVSINSIFRNDTLLEEPTSMELHTGHKKIEQVKQI